MSQPRESWRRSGRTTSVAALAAGAAALIATVPALTGCAAASTGSTGAGEKTTITVFAAASLTESFTTIGRQFEKTRTGTTVKFNFGASSTLATQITQGAPADVFAAASTSTMDTVVKADEATGSPRTFVTNSLQIAVPTGNPGRITGLVDFANPAKKTVLCDEQVPCGALAKNVFAAANITPKPVDRGVDVKAVLNKVSLREADAALVYRTDVKSAAGKVIGLDFPQAKAQTTAYPIVVVKSSKSADAAAAFATYVGSPPAQRVLTAAGFTAATG